MQQSMTLPGDSLPAVDALRAEVALVSATFQRLFLHKWQASGADPKVLAVWHRAFELAGLTPAEVRVGLAKAARLDWPPSAGQFVHLCRPPTPTIAAGFLEATRWARDPQAFGDAWSHVVVQLAAKHVGDFRLRQLDEHAARRLFTDAMQDLLARYDAGEELSAPVQAKLTHQPVSRPMFDVPRMSAAEAIADLRRALHREPAP